jgi:hypothetical protein
MIWLIIIGLAVLQSWFGVGLLLMGTPILLLRGLSYQDALWTLLPCSFTVSTLQLFLDRRISRSAVRGMFLFAVPMLVVGLVVNLVFGVKLHIGLAVAAMLTFAAVLRLWPAAAVVVRAFAARHEAIILGVIGLVHGMTNMGGSLLLDQAASRHTDKLDVRQHVAVGYVIFVVTQLLVLTFSTGNGMRWETVGLAAAAGTTFLLLGRRTFHSFSQRTYAIVLSVFMLVVAAMLVIRN